MSIISTVQILSLAKDYHLILDDQLSNVSTRVVCSISGITTPGDDISLSTYKRNTVESITDRKPIVGFLNGDFGLSGENQFLSALDGAGAGLQKAFAMVKAVNDETGKLLGDINYIIKSEMQTVLQWTGSAKPVFNVPVLFLAWRPDQSVLDPIRTLFLATNPESVGSGTKITTTAPGKYEAYYNIKEKNYKTSGTSALMVSSWFKANNLVLKGFSMTLSKDVNEYGEPLYASGTISFEPFKMLSGKEIASWIIAPSVLG